MTLNVENIWDTKDALLDSGSPRLFFPRIVGFLTRSKLTLAYEGDGKCSGLKEIRKL